jgi:hypothetical protein
LISTNLVLSRDGTVLLDSGLLNEPFHVDVPASDGTYRLEMGGFRARFPFEFSTQVSGVWTFRSAHVDGTTPKMLPMSAVRFLPSLDLDNTAPAGKVFDVKVDVERQFGAPAASVSKLTVEVSYDGGTTWKKVSVSATSDGGIAKLNHPKRPGFVSLRGSVTESDGSTAQVTIFNAYRTR